MTPERDRAYLAWIRTLPCLVCARASQAHHVGAHGIGQKVSDYRTVPLCAAHHTAGSEAVHRMGRRVFERVFRLDLEAEIKRLNGRYHA